MPEERRRAWTIRMGGWMERDRFEELVADAWNEIPSEFRDRIENVELIVEDLPSPDDLAAVGITSPYGLLGLYRGVSLPRRSTFYQNVLPDVIVIYRLPILRICRNDRDVVRQIRDTVIHEIGHYFGMDEEQVRAAMHLDEPEEQR